GAAVGDVPPRRGRHHALHPHREDPGYFRQRGLSGVRGALLPRCRGRGGARPRCRLSGLVAAEEHRRGCLEGREGVSVRGGGEPRVL
ncbi:hypothetical protein E4U42_000722, partial [Claviceps africana]